jgi:uncharacterized RDD family membrane protein YckC
MLTMADQTYAAPEAAATSTVTSERAGFGLRLAAYLIDAIVLGIVWGVIAVAIGSTGYIIGWILSIGYFIYLEGGESGQTLGKKATGIQVRAVDGGPLGYGRAFLRYIGTIVSTIPIYLGFFWMLWDADKQTWHDKIANSVVVPVR